MNRLPVFHSLFSVVLCGFATVSAAPAPTPPDERAIAAFVAAGRTEARAEWWGFDPADSTAALQAAIDSGARKLLIGNLGAPWITDELQLASDQEIVFEKGVVVQAKRGAFKKPTSSLFSAWDKKNITLTGHDATLKMWKQDYDDATQYKHAEWRHVLNFHSCANVRISGLTLADSGGDGIYLGVARRDAPCSDFVIKDVRCVNNYRQGISVISARNLLIERCLLKDTSGTPPMAGIDFEPNHPSEELVNCVMRDCVSENNLGDAYVLYLRPLNASSRPISVRIENCRAIGCRSSARFVTGNETDAAGVTGTMEFVRCTFEGSKDAGIAIGDHPATGARVSFVDCQILNAAVGEPGKTPVELSSRANGSADIGNLSFANLTITDPLDRLPMSYHDMSGGVGLHDITGTLVVKRGGETVTHTLTPKLIAEWMPFRSFKQIARMDMRGLRLVPALPDVSPDGKPRSRARQRGLSEWLLWAEAGEKAAFTVAVHAVGKSAPGTSSVTLLTPSGKRTKLKEAATGEETSYEFTATETGAHKIVCDPKSATATVHSAAHRVCLYSESASIHFLGTTGRYFFWVPTGTKEFAVKVAGENAGERVKAALYDPAGKLVEEMGDISQAHQFVAAPRDASAGEIWSLQLDRPGSGVLEDFHVRLQGVPPLLSHNPESLLKPTKEAAAP